MFVPSNKLLMFFLFEEILLILALFGPFLGIGIHLLLFSFALNVLFFLFANKIHLPSEISTGNSIKKLVRIFTMGAASTVVPVALFLYVGAENWIRFFAFLSVLFCGLGYVKIMKRLEH